MTDINATLTPILTQIINLFPSLLDLVLAALPIIIAMALIGFVLGIFSGILGRIRM